MQHLTVLPRALAGFLFVLGCLSSPLAFGIETTQQVPLSTGWNAVWLNVDPVYTTGAQAGQAIDVADLFTDPSITIVATPTKPFGSVEFITDPASGFFNRSGWEVWQRTTELGSNTLSRLFGYRGYLIKSTADVTVNVTGVARYVPHEWEPDSYNLAGFSLHSATTFGAFFADISSSHPVNRIFRLNAATGNWEAVRPTDSMNSGEAYWIYCDGRSDWTGSVKVDFQGYLDFGAGEISVAIPGPSGDLMVSLRELTFTNVMGTDRSVTLGKELPATAGAAALADDLRVYNVGLDPTTLSYSNEGQLPTTPFNVSTGTSRTVVLGALRDWNTGARDRENLYRLDFDYHSYWLPASASNENLSDATQGADDPGFAGLWVGEVSFDKVSSITENGRPLAPTTSKAPMKVLLHADATGATRLLSHALIMQTKVVPGTDAVPELIVFTDEAKIPFYEGIEERAGKRVGRRIECVGYDMPRDYATDSQSTAFLTVVAQANGLLDQNSVPDPAQVTAALVEAYVRGNPTRPPTLGETYLRAWDLSGGLGPNTVVSTTAPLVLDPFHRSNPFRHAFHPQHGTGRDITRAITMTFDGNASSGLLTGTYHESITGLAVFPIEVEGSLRLERIVDVAALAE